MSWLRLDDGFAEHEKIIGLSDRAFRLHVKAMCYCARRLTDGSVNAAFVPKGERRAVAELVAAGLWEPCGTDFEIHDYLEWNPTRTEIEGLREQSRERMRDVRTNIARSAASPTPLPKPTPKKQVLHLRSIFAEFWDAYPRKVGKRTAESAFMRAATRDDPAAIVAGAERLRDDPNLPEMRFVPHPTTWLNRDSWNDEPYPARGGGKARSVGNLLALADRAERGELA